MDAKTRHLEVQQLYLFGFNHERSLRNECHIYNCLSVHEMPNAGKPEPTIAFWGVLDFQLDHFYGYSKGELT